jgi:diadenosine tetraphosphate (Ap4A) HIT family hydrolase
MIHERLLTDCSVVGRFDLCHLLLMDDASYPWCILVPDREGIEEIYQLDENDQRQLLTESSHLGQAMMQLFSGDKLNIAALGNVVSQLHIHHIVRYRHDPAWPAPVWGHRPPASYDAAVLSKTIERLRAGLADYLC